MKSVPVNNRDALLGAGSIAQVDLGGINFSGACYKIQWFFRKEGTSLLFYELHCSWCDRLPRPRQERRSAIATAAVAAWRSIAVASDGGQSVATVTITAWRFIAVTADARQSVIAAVIGDARQSAVAAVTIAAR